MARLLGGGASYTLRAGAVGALHGRASGRSAHPTGGQARERPPPARTRRAVPGRPPEANRQARQGNTPGRPPLAAALGPVGGGRGGGPSADLGVPRIRVGAAAVPGVAPAAGAPGTMDRTDLFGGGGQGRKGEPHDLAAAVRAHPPALAERRDQRQTATTRPSSCRRPGIREAGDPRRAPRPSTDQEERTVSTVHCLLGRACRCTLARSSVTPSAAGSIRGVETPVPQLRRRRFCAHVRSASRERLGAPPCSACWAA